MKLYAPFIREATLRVTMTLRSEGHGGDPSPKLQGTLSEHGGACHFGSLPPLPWPLGHVRLISFLGKVYAALLFFSTC